MIDINCIKSQIHRFSRLYRNLKIFLLLTKFWRSLGIILCGEIKLSENNTLRSFWKISGTELAGTKSPSSDSVVSKPGSYQGN